MAHRFMVPDSSPSSSPAPSTPNKRSQPGFTFSQFDDNPPSMTPVGQPSSAASFTPAGAPSEAYLASSVFGYGETKPLNFGSQLQGNSRGRNSYERNDSSNAPLGRSIRARGRQPSGLSRGFSVNDYDEEPEMEDEEDAEGEEELPVLRGSTFGLGGASFKPTRQIEDDGEEDMSYDAEAEMERLIEDEMDAEADEQESEESAQGDSEVGDMFLNMRHDDRPYGRPIIGDESDLMMLNTPAATDKVRKEAEHIFKRSTAQLGGSLQSRGLQFATIAKDIYTQHDPARITEPSNLILKTEELVCRLYDEGVGTQEDEEKLDNSLADVTYRLVRLWNDYVEELPPPEGEDLATIGPDENAEPFEKAVYVAHLMLRMHHTKFDSHSNEETTSPLPEILFDWMHNSHNLYPNQVREISCYKPSPACHSLYWQTLRNALLRGDVNGAKQLLQNAGWENVRRGPRGEYVYTGKALENVRRFAEATCEMLEQCPAIKGDWDIFNSSWTLFHVQARGSLDRLTLFAEGRDGGLVDAMNDGYLQETESMSTMARKASSQIPWDIYENLQTVYGIVLGNQEAILETAQDWCEATVGLFGWLDDGEQRHRNPRTSQPYSFGASFGQSTGSDDYFERLISVLHLVVNSGLVPNTMNPVEVALASAFEGNVNAVIGCLRTWSLPVSCAVAEIASLGKWLPPTEITKPMALDILDMDDLALLGVSQPTADDTEGIKDATLVLYARELAGIEHLSPQRDGWEMAIQVLGRMDVPAKSEETVGELLRDLLATLNENSSTTVDKMWKILNDLGMVNFAEETAEVRGVFIHFV